MSLSEDSRQVDDNQKLKACPGKCTNEQIARREAMIQAKNSLIDNTIYHIRTLSNAVIGFSDLLSAEPLGKDQSEYVQEINLAGHRLSVLASEVLDWTQLLAGQLQIAKVRFPMSDILYEIRRLLSWATKEKSLDYEIITDPEMPAYVQTDQDRLLKCLVNLTASAIKHTSSGSVSIHVQTEWIESELFIRFDVIDTGEGIEEKKLERIFEPTVYRIEMDEEILSSLDKSLTVTTGLPMTKQLCNLLGGTIEGQSKVNEGSTFTVRIPAGVDPNSEPKLGLLNWADDKAEKETQKTEDKSPGTVLLVEDQQSNRTVISLMLESLGVKVESAESGERAISLCEQDSYDLILMDLKMPKMNGFETTHCLRQKGITAPIVALSATVLNEEEKSHISAIFDSFLTKPADSEKLSAVLEQFLEGYSRPKDKPTLRADEECVSEYEIMTIEYGDQDE